MDQAHATLRATTSSLNEERRQLAELQRAADDRKALRQRIANLRRANDNQRNQLILLRGEKSGHRRDVSVGDADSGLEVEQQKLPALSEGRPLPLSPLTPSQQNYLASLPSTAILQARTRAYQTINARLEAQSKDLLSQSIDLEAQLRKVVGLCCGVSEDKVEGMITGLVQAVESEEGAEVEVGRVREFLRRVESVE